MVTPRRPREDSGLRPGQGAIRPATDATIGATRLADDDAGHGARHVRLHGARTGARPGGRPSRRHLRVRRRAVRDAHGRARVRGETAGGHDVGDPDEGSAGHRSGTTRHSTEPRPHRPPLSGKDAGIAIPVRQRSGLRARDALDRVGSTATGERPRSLPPPPRPRPHGLRARACCRGWWPARRSSRPQPRGCFRAPAGAPRPRFDSSPASPTTPGKRPRPRYRRTARRSPTPCAPTTVGTSTPSASAAATRRRS